MAKGRRQGWLPLKAGDTVDLIAPGYRTTQEELEGALRFLRDWDLKPRLPKAIYARDLLCSNSDEMRFRFLKNALLASDSKAIWCLRGGYGSNRLVPALAKLKRPNARPKLFIGLSDVTTLHVFLNQQWYWPTVHGPLLDRLGRGAALKRYENELWKFAFGEVSEIRFGGLKPMNSLARRRGILKGKVSGGNLIVLQSSLGTSSEWDTNGRILFFEDIGERGYRIDRVLEQFEQAGLFDQAKAVIFGQFTGGAEPDGSNLIPRVLRRFAEKARLPVFSGLASGHDIIQRPLPFQTSSTLRHGPSNCELVCATGGECL